MSDDPPEDILAPWTIKACPPRTRRKVVLAAQRENLTVGQWLEKRVDEWEDDGAPVAVQAENHVRNPVSDLAAVLRAAGMTPEHMPREVRALVNDLARQARGKRPRLARRQALLPA
jgi:hypothetical protein